MLTTGPFRIGAAVATGGALNRAHPLNVGLVGCWRALPGRMGGTWYDLARANHGTLAGGVTWRGTSRPGGAGELKFDGTSGRVTAPLALGGIANAPITLSCWINPTVLPQVSIPLLNGLGSDGIGLIFFGGSSSNLQLLLGGDAVFDSGYTLPTAGLWYHCVASYDGTTATVYVNGARAPTTITGGYAAPTTGTFIGCNGDQASYFFSGSIDDVRIYARALSATSVAALYRLSRQGYPGVFNRSGVSSPALFGSTGGTTTPISSSDTGAAADAATLAAALSWPETGAATEGTPTLLARLATVADAGTAAEGTPTLLAGLATVADAGTGTEGTPTLLVGLSLAEGGSGSDSATLVASLATADSGTGTDSGSIFVGLSVGDSDSGTGTDGASLASTLTTADTGSGLDLATLIAGLSSSDGGTGTDTGSVFAGLTVSDGDSGTGTDGGSLAATLATSDVASGVDLATLIASIATADSGTATDTGSVFAGLTVADSDSGHGTDGGSLAATVTTVEAAAGLDLAAILATMATADGGTGTDAGSIFSGLTVADSDSGVGSEGAATLAAAVATADAAAGGESASTAAALAAADAGLGLDGQSLLASLARSDSGVGSDAGSVEDVTGSITIDVSAADAGAGLEATVALAAALADAESAAGSDGGWVLVGTVDAPYRDRQFLRMIADALAATGEFDEVRTTGLPEDVGRPASDLRLACLELAGWQDVDDWADVESTEQIRTVHYSLYLLVRLEDPDERDDELDRLVAVAANALNGIALGDVSVPNKTRLLKGTYQPAASIERRIKVDGQFVYTIPDFNRHSATDA